MGRYTRNDLYCLDNSSVLPHKLKKYKNKEIFFTVCLPINKIPFEPKIEQGVIIPNKKTKKWLRNF